MKIMINFSTLKSGGGQNVGMNFLYSIFETNLIRKNFYFFVAENSAIHNFLKLKNYSDYYVVSRNPIKRIIFEIFLSHKILSNNNIDIIYSYFGIGFFPKDIPQVSGSADSNLYFPEINFWSDYKGISRIKKKLIDKYRIWGIKRAAGVIYENKILEVRAKELYNLKNTIFIKPSINFNLEEVSIEIPLPNSNVTKGLFLCGWQLNKNIMKIPEIAYELKKKGHDFNFILTAPLDNSVIHREFLAKVIKYNVSEMVSVIGQVSKNELKSLYSQVNYVFLLSKLESFSNNIIEAWYFDKPLIVSNELWSKSICRDAAIYVDRDSAVNIAEEIIKLNENNSQVNNLIAKGKIMLIEYPTIEERIREEMEYLTNVYKNC